MQEKLRDRRHKDDGSAGSDSIGIGKIATGIETYEYTPASTDIPRSALYSKHRRTGKNKKEEKTYES